MEEDFPKMYFIVNSSLNMGKGKVAGQCCHAVSRMYFSLFVENEINKRERKVFDRWIFSGEKKVVLKASEEEIYSLLAFYKDLSPIVVRDAGLTQIKEGSLTVIAFSPVNSPSGEKMEKLKLL